MLKYTQPLQIENRFGQIVNVWFRNMVGFSETMTIRLEKPNGEVVDYRIMKSRIGSDLRVGRQVTNGGGAGAGSQGSGSGSSGSGTGSGDPPGGEVICGNSQVDDGPQRRTCMRR
jgi:hypothetical protein